MDSGPTTVIEAAFDETQLIGVPSFIRACSAASVLELWFEMDEGTRLCEHFVRAFLRQTADPQNHPCYVLKPSRIAASGRGGIEPVEEVGGFEVVTDADALDALVAAGWNAELEPFVVLVGGAALTDIDEAPPDELCRARFAVACGADGCVAQIIPLGEPLNLVRTAVTEFS